jgi:hypothetical protein
MHEICSSIVCVTAVEILFVRREHFFPTCGIQTLICQCLMHFCYYDTKADVSSRASSGMTLYETDAGDTAIGGRALGGSRRFTDLNICD